MAWSFQEALDYYQKQGAPANQMMLVNLLKEIQQEQGGRLSRAEVSQVSEAYGIRDSLVLAVIRRMPSLHLEDTHCLELCAGKACGRKSRLGTFVEKTYGSAPKGFQLKYVGCMHRCRTGPNVKWDGVLYEGADEALLRKLIEGGR